MLFVEVGHVKSYYMLNVYIIIVFIRVYNTKGAS